MSNKNKLYVHYAVLALALAGFITTLVFFIMSFNYEVYYVCDADWNPILDANGNKIPEGSEFTSDKDLAVLLLGFLTLIGFAGYNTYLLAKKDSYSKMAYTALVGVEGSLAFCYCFGVFFKALAKAASKGKAFDFAGNVWYMIIGIIGALAIGCAVALFLMARNKKAKVEVNA